MTEQTPIPARRLSFLLPVRRAHLPRLAAMAVAGAFLFPSLAASQNRCGFYAQIVPVLVEKYGERLTTYGVTPGGWVVEQWSNPESGTWTILRKNAQGMFCLMGSGEAFTIRQPVSEKGGAL